MAVDKDGSLYIFELKAWGIAKCKHLAGVALWANICTSFWAVVEMQNLVILYRMPGCEAETSVLLHNLLLFSIVELTLQSDCHDCATC
jgi:hypothetical protein